MHIDREPEEEQIEKKENRGRERMDRRRCRNLEEDWVQIQEKQCPLLINHQSLICIWKYDLL